MSSPATNSPMRLASSEYVTPENEAKWNMEFKKATNGRDNMNLLQFMQCTKCRSRYYAVKLFDTLDSNQNGVLSFHEYSRLMSLLQTGSGEELGSFAFDMFDTDRDGIICRAELKEALKASVEESESVMTGADVDRLVAVLSDLFTDQATEHITKGKFTEVLKSYPDILGNFTIGDGARAAALNNPTTLIMHKRRDPNKFEEAWRWVQDNPQRTFTNTLTILIIAACFCWRFARYASDCSGADLDFRDPHTTVTRREVKDRLQEVFNIHMSGADAKYMSFSLDMSNDDPVKCKDARKRKLLTWTLAIAKGCGQGMKCTFTLILLPVSRTLMTKLRRTFLKDIFDFDNAIAYHRLLGKIGFALAWAHTLLHVVDVIRWQNNNLFKEWSFAFPEKNPPIFNLSSVTPETNLIQGMPEGLLRDPSDQPNVWVLLGSWFGFTGIILIVTYSIAALFAFDYPKKLSMFSKRPGEKESTMTGTRRVILRIGNILNNFNYFWYTHHLFALFYLAMLFHPFPHVPDERNEWAWSDSWLWVLLPVLFYSMERINRSIQSYSHTSVLGLRILPGKVVQLKTVKPDGLKVKAGQYVFINCYQIAPFEWHPFTLTSAPHDNYLSVHIRSAGDWTNAFYNAVKNYKSYSMTRSHIDVSENVSYPFNVKVAGPYGAPAQSYQEFGVVVCVGAGIGVTPFASVLSNVLNSIRTGSSKTLKKVYFHWTVRSRTEASWFKTLIDEISADDTDNVLDINIHITSLKEGNDLRVMLLRLAEFEDIDTEQGKLVSKSVTYFGRPDWSNILRTVQRRHSDEARIGVFYCGPTALKRALKAECIKRSRLTDPKFVFRKEVF